ncbi:MAG: Maf family protein [Acidobacteria bacterium]|nr:Maf family protein [Acidobacteriota bacterium]
MRLILASASPRRAEVLRDAGISFDAIPVRIDETRWHGEAPAHLVRRLAKEEAARSVQETTRVTFAALSSEEIERYVVTGEPFDKAGGYAIQGRAGRFVTRVEGCYFNVVGLPLSLLYRSLIEFGWSPD